VVALVFLPRRSAVAAGAGATGNAGPGRPAEAGSSGAARVPGATMEP
jgi:hypothetical protein